MLIQYGWVDGVETNPPHTIGIFDQDARKITVEVDEIAGLIRCLQEAARDCLKFMSRQTLSEGDEVEETKASKDDVIWTREFAPGFVGGKEVVQKATDDELQMLIDLNNKIAELDRQLLSLAKMRKNVVQGIRER